MYCPRCGNDQKKTDQQCARCGYLLSQQKRNIAPFIISGGAALAIAVSIAVFILAQRNPPESADTPVPVSIASAGDFSAILPSLVLDDASVEITMDVVSTIQVDSGAQLTTVTFPSEFSGSSYYDSVADNHTVEEIIHLEDGSVAVVYQQADYAQMMGQFADECIQGLENLHLAFPSIRMVEHNDLFAKIDIFVDMSMYQMNNEEMLIYQAGLIGYTYQVFSGMPPTQINVAVIVHDQNTSDVIGWEIYPK